MKVVFIFLVAFLYFMESNSTSLADDELKEKPVKIGKIVAKKAHWVFKYKKIVRENSELRVSIRYINKGAYMRNIYLGQGSNQATTVLNDDGTVTTSPTPNNESPLATLTSLEGNVIFAKKVEGIETEGFTNLDSNKGKTATFYFDIPSEMKYGYFECSWVTMIMRGATGVLPVDILIEIP